MVHLVFDRFFTGERLRGPLYECPACRSPVRLIAMVPYGTVVLSGGRCPNCGERLPWRAVILTAGAAGRFALAYLAFDELGAGLLGGLFEAGFLHMLCYAIDGRPLLDRAAHL